ncbi:MAG: MATE family efflux transporter [Myxococcota bacterium]
MLNEEEEGAEGAIGNDLTWREEPRRELLRLSWPIAVSMVSYAVMTLVDTLFVGRLGPSALAGVGLGGVAAFTALCFPMGLLRGVKVNVSQAVGAGRPSEARRQVSAGVLVAVVLGTVLLLAGFGIAAALPYITASEAAGRAATSYTWIRLLGTPLVLIYVALREGCYGVGDSRSPMVAAVAGNITNIALDTLFIVVLEWGVAGAAWASVAGHVLEAAILLYRGRNEGWVWPARRDLRALWRVGVPTGVQFLLEVGAFAVLATLLSALSEHEMAAHQIALQVIHFTFLPALAVSEAVSVLAGQAVGARRDELVHRVARDGMWVAGAYAALCTIVLVGFANPIVSAFTDEISLRASARNLLYVAAVFQIADAANVIARGALRGVGDVRYAAALGIITAWVCTPPLTWLLGWELGFGALGGWIGLCLEIIAGAALLWVRLVRNGWKRAAHESRLALSTA